MSHCFSSLLQFPCDILFEHMPKVIRIISNYSKWRGKCITFIFLLNLTKIILCIGTFWEIQFCQFFFLLQNNQHQNLYACFIIHYSYLPLLKSKNTFIQVYNRQGFFQTQVLPRLFLPSFSLSDVLCIPTDFIWRQMTPFEAMTGRTAIIDDLLAEVFRRFPQL